MQQRKTTTAIVSIDGGIMRVEAIGDESTPETVQETLGAVDELSGGGPVPILFDARKWPSAGGMAWAAFIKRVEQTCSAGAVLVIEDEAPYLGSFPEIISSLLIPFEVFTNEDEAIAFLRQFGELS